MATRHSSRRRTSGRAPRSSPPHRKLLRTADSAVSARNDGPDFDEVLGHFADASALIETARAAFRLAEEESDVKAITPSLITLDRGFKELRRTYSELDLAIQRQRKGGA